jgi:hypothetical protein
LKFYDQTWQEYYKKEEKHNKKNYIKIDLYKGFGLLSNISFGSRQETEINGERLASRIQ